MNKDLRAQMQGDKDRRINDYIFDQKEFGINKSLFKEVVGKDLNRQEEQLALVGNKLSR